MKKYQYIALAAAAVVLAGCDFFDSKSPSAMDPAQVFSNVASTEQVIAGVYENFGNDKSYRNRLACGYQGLNTDVEHGTKNSGRADWNIYAMTPVSGDLSTANGKDPWGYLNSSIEKCNNIIEGIEEFGNLNDEKMQYMLGEAYFLRSFCYYEMVKLWGDVPPRFVSITKDPEGLKMKKADRTNVLKQIRIDLKKSADFLPWSKDCPGTAKNSTCRPSKAAALALLARIDLFYAGKGVRPATWQSGPEFLVDDPALRAELNTEVMWACEQILNNGNEQAKFQPNYEDIFKKICADETNYYNSEVIWEIPFAESRGQVLQYNCTKMSDAVGGLKNNEGGSSNSAVGIVPTLYYDYEPTDVRRDVTMARYIWVYDDGTKFNSDAEKVALAFPEKGTDAKILYQKSQMVGDWYGNKYRVEWMARNRSNSDDGINFPIIRYADVMLMAAEASIGGIGGDMPTDQYGLDGANLFNQVRTRAHASAKSLTMANLQEERKLEFTGEYIRKFDLIRWGILKETMLAAHERLANMNTHSGEFAGLADTIYFKYKYVGDEYSFSAGIKGFLIDSVYGLNKGETGVPPTYSKENGWIKSSVYSSESNGRELAPDNYMLFDREYPERLNGRQLWPIFSVNVGQSNGALWNDYDYANMSSAE